MAQSNLDRVMQPRPPTFSTHGLIDYIVQLIVEEDEVSNKNIILSY